MGEQAQQAETRATETALGMPSTPLAAQNMRSGAGKLCESVWWGAVHGDDLERLQPARFRLGFRVKGLGFRFDLSRENARNADPFWDIPALHWCSTKEV